jgi:Flp pilus assembly protein TadD
LARVGNRARKPDQEIGDDVPYPTSFVRSVAPRLNDLKTDATAGFVRNTGGAIVAFVCATALSFGVVTALHVRRTATFVSTPVIQRPAVMTDKASGDTAPVRLTSAVLVRASEPLGQKGTESPLSNYLYEQALDQMDTDKVKMRELLEDALTVDPKNIRALRTLSRDRLDQEDTDAAIALANRCLVIAPDDQQCRETRRWALAWIGRPEEAEAERCYKERPDDVTCSNGLAWLRIRQGRLAEARALLAEARRLAPDSALVAATAGALAQASGDMNGAVAQFKVACSGGQEYACMMAWKLQSDTGR